MRKFAIALTAGLAAFASACATASAPAEPQPRIDLSRCRPAGIQEDVLCGVFNVPENRAVPNGRVLPLSVIVREAGRTNVPLPAPLYSAALGRFGLPRLPKGALDHIRYPITVDGSAFGRATSFVHKIDEKDAMRAYRDAFPRPSTAS